MNILNLIDNNHLTAAPADSLYENSPFRELRKLAPKTKGKRFEEISIDVLNKLGYDAKKSKAIEYDIVLDEVKTELKGSTLSKDYFGNVDFKFLQIRMEQDWDQLMLIAFWPLDCRMFTLSKEDVQHYIDAGVFTKQHGGQASNNDLYMYNGDPAKLDRAVEVTSKVANPTKGQL